MGEHEISPELQQREQVRSFVRALLEDLQALERMLAEGLIESDVTRIGSEQEYFLVDGACRPARSALAVLEHLDTPPFTTELGLFNLEANLGPRVLAGSCLGDMERELNDRLRELRAAAEQEGSRVLLCGILPTLEEDHLTLEYMTPIARYHELNRAMQDLRRGRFRTFVKGLDELVLSHDNVMLEACNTSFQIHFQVAPEHFARLYNLAQVTTAPVLAAAVNSPIMLHRRLWHETRVALMQQSLDVRSESKARRGERTRVSFGDRWVRESVLEIYREDVARFRVLLAIQAGESPLAQLERGELPPLRALCLHNGTVYRWNRPCYGLTDGRAHLRIENRALPSGPTPADEVANAAFWFGLMCGLDAQDEDVTRRMSFEDAKANFMAAARYGLHARFLWFGGHSWNADRLILEELLPLARRGLERRAIDPDDAERFLGIVRERVESGRTGSQWALDSVASMGEGTRAEQCCRALCSAMAANEQSGRPVHTWPLATLDEHRESRESFRTVAQLMTSDVFTLHPDDVVDLAASLMDWEHIRHVPVEDDDEHLVGMVSHRTLLRLVAHGAAPATLAVREIMNTDLITISPDAPSLEAIRRMREHRVSCLPVVRDGHLVGIISERDFMKVTGRLLEHWLEQP